MLRPLPEKPLSMGLAGPVWLLVAGTVLLSALAWGFAPLAVDGAVAAPKKCMGKKVDRVVRADGGIVRIGYREVVRVTGGKASIQGGPFSTICSGPGPQRIRAGKGRAWIDSGAGNDRIRLTSASHRNEVVAGPGDDLVVGSRGNDAIVAGPRVADGDTDQVFGRGGNDTIRDFGGVGNEIFGEDGSDRLHSLGPAVSIVHGGNGTDFLFSNGGEADQPKAERLFGERGNDRLRADLPGGTGGAFLDPGAGDDWVWGTDRADRIVYSAGIKKIDARGGDDLVVSAARGGTRVEGGTGEDTISFASHTPPGGRGLSGVFVDLDEGYSIGTNRVPLEGFEDVIGSAFDDDIRARNGVVNDIRGGLGDDTLRGDPGDGDSADGGIGSNLCFGFGSEVNCNGLSPGDPGPSNPVVQIDVSGVLTLIGSSLGDTVLFEYDGTAGEFVVDADPAPEASGLCREEPDGLLRCPATRQILNGLLAYGGGGDDRIELGDAIPGQLTTTINGGSGSNVLTGGRSRDYISSYQGSSAGTVISGRGGSDMLYLRDDVEISGGPGPDVLHAADPCVGGRISGGDDQDNMVFASARRGVSADLGVGAAIWAEGGCPSGGIVLEHDIEDLEGSRFDDLLTLGPRSPTQDGPGGLLGREGIDTLDSRNGRRDTVTVGAGGRDNVVIADPFDKVFWDWGLADF